MAVDNEFVVWGPAGETVTFTFLRISDGYFWNDTLEVWQAAAVTVASVEDATNLGSAIRSAYICSAQPTSEFQWVAKAADGRLLGGDSGVGDFIDSGSTLISTSAVSISNIALGHLGAQPITSLEEDSQEARYCKIFWDNVRDTLLRTYPWNFADTKIVAASLDVPTFDDDIWAYAYSYPGNCLLVKSVYLPEAEVEQDFKVMLEQLTSGEKRLLIMTNAEDAVLSYTARIEATSIWDATFINAMAYALAAKIAVPITKNPKIAEYMERRAQEAIPQAQADDHKERKSDDDEVSPWETDRLR